MHYIKTRAVAELQKLVAELTEAVPPSALSATTVGQHEPEEGSGEKKNNSFSSYFKSSARTSHVAPDLTIESIEKELSLYLLLEAGQETEPMEWRKRNEGHFPLLTKLVKKYICVPNTSSPSE